MRIFCMETGTEWPVDADVRCDDMTHRHIVVDAVSAAA